MNSIDMAKTEGVAQSALRLEEVIAFPFGGEDLVSQQQIMKKILTTPGYSGGGPSMAHKGVFVTKESLLSKGIPAAEYSVSAYQAIRQSQFTNRNTLINWGNSSRYVLRNSLPKRIICGLLSSSLTIGLQWPLFPLINSQ